MEKSKQKKLEQAGWKVGDIKDFLRLSDEESALIAKTQTRTARSRNQGQSKHDSTRISEDPSLKPVPHSED